MMKRYAIYGVIGWFIEVIWTGFSSALRGDWRLVSRTYLWMFFIYGLAVILEPVHQYIRDYYWWVRGIIWTVVIFSIEYMTGFLLDIVIGSCPWSYAQVSPFSTVSGYVRFDYAPAWFVAGIAFERIHDYMKRIGIY